MKNLNRREFLLASVKAGTTALGVMTMAQIAANNMAIGPSIAHASGQTPEYSIFACKYAGAVTRSKAVSLWNTGWTDTATISFFVWAIKAKSGEIILVDTGTSPEVAAARKYSGYVNPLAVLAGIDVTADNVSTIVLTHAHFDHITNIEGFAQAFPKAKFYIQQREFDFYVKNPLSQRSPISALFDPAARKALERMAGSDRLKIVDGDQILTSGIEVLLAPGHTPGLQVVRVNTEKGPAIIGSDCAHLFEGYQKDTGSCYMTDMLASIQSFDKVKSKAAANLIFPGHDILMHENYPKVTESVTQLV